MKNAEKFQQLSTLGVPNILTRQGLEAASMFIGELYGTDSCLSLNDLRCHMASSRKRYLVKKLPPTEDTFKLHVLRCILQLKVWRSALMPIHEDIDPSDYGYEKDSTTQLFLPKCMSQQPAAPELLNDIVCFCKSGECHTGCICLEYAQPCTQACSCEANLMPDDDDNLACTNLMTIQAAFGEIDDN